MADVDRDRGDAEIVYVPRAPHVCDLPPAAGSTDQKIRPGTIVRCKACGAYYELEGAHWEHGVRSVGWMRPRWRQLDRIDLLWRIFTGRIKPEEPTT